MTSLGVLSRQRYAMETDPAGSKAEAGTAPAGIKAEAGI